jgi:amino acid transporter
MGVVTAIGFIIGQLTSITVLIQLLTTVTVLVQALAQIVALTVLRRRQPNLRRPYRMFLYPLPSILAALGWLVIYGYADKNAPGLHPIELSLAWVAVGTLAFLLWARRKNEWPFGPKTINEQYLNADPLLLELDLEEVAGAGEKNRAS